jgi:Abnormal spindle-like microcephaly-assoc'd, ASPM-SPD-2-Hydin
MHRGYFLASAVLAALLSIGCGGGSGDGAHQDVPAGHLAVFPSSLSFGQVQVGEQVTKAATLKAGNARIAVRSADWSGEGYSVSGITFPFTVAAGQSVSFKVTFAPQKSGSTKGNITFATDATNLTTESFNASAFETNSPDSSGSHKVTLAWHPSNANAIAYNIYRGVRSQGPFAKLNSTPHTAPTFTDASVDGGQTYFYVTTALNKRGKESKPSNQVEVTIPNS